MTDQEDKTSSLFDFAKLKELGGLKAGTDGLLAVDPELYEKFMKHSSKTVKRDVVAKNMVFLTGLSAFTSQPINLFLRGESSIGKTYNVIEILKYFPEENVWLLGGLSPTALVHDRGKLVDENGEEIEMEKKPVKPLKAEYTDNRDYAQARQDFNEAMKTWIKRLKTSYYLVDLSGKIICFLESPSIETFNRLRPVLSHDSPRISYKFTDKGSAGRLQTQHVVIQGFPACIFCTTSQKHLQDLATRSFTITPEITEQKYHDANVLTGTKAAFPWEFERDFDRELLEGYLRFLQKTLSDFQAVVPYGEVFVETFSARFPRSMRDFKHVLELIKVSALFHKDQRPVLVQEDKKQCYVMAVREDYKFIMGLWREIQETTETSAPGQIMQCFHEVIKQIPQDEFTIKDVVDLWNSKFKQKKSSQRIREWVKFLCEVGYLTKNPNPNDKRSYLLSVIKEETTEKVESQFGVIFTLDLFKAWQERVKKMSPQNSLKLKATFRMETEASCENIFNKYYYAEEEPVTPAPTPIIKLSPKLEEMIPNVKELVRLGALTEDKCCICGFKGRMEWQVTLHDGTWNMLCDKCGLALEKQLERDNK